MSYQLFKRYKVSENLRRIIKNFFSLSLMYGLDMLLPLITIPFLIRYIGVDKVGLISFATAVIGYFGIVINYGFNLTATKEVAHHSEDPQQLQAIFNNVTTSKLGLIVLSAFVLVILLLVVPQFREFYYLYGLVFFGVCAQSLTPIWFFQGMQNLKFITLHNSISKVFFTLLIFLFVQREGDFWIAALLTSLGFVAASVFSWINLWRTYQINFSVASCTKVRDQLRSGMYVFLSQVKISFFSNFNIIILGFIAGNAAVAYFTSADKIIRALAIIIVPVVTALYPYFSNLLKHNKAEAYANVKKIAVYGTLFYLPILVIIFFYAQEIVLIIFGSGMENVAVIVKILILLPLLIYLNNLSGTQMLLNMGRDKLFFNVLLSTAVLNVILVVPLTYKYSFWGTAIAVVISEFYLCAMMYIAFLMAKKRF